MRSRVGTLAKRGIYTNELKAFAPRTQQLGRPLAGFYYSSLPMTRRAWALFAAMSVLWGLPYLLIKVAVAEVDPSVVVFVRLGLSAVILVPVSVAAGAFKGLRRRWRRLAVIASLGIVVPFLLIGYGELHVTSSLAALLVAADPLFIVLLALILDRSERTSGIRLVGVVFGLFGVAALFGLDVGGDALALIGAAMILCAALCYAISALLVKGLTDVPRLGSVTATLTTAAILILPLAATRLPERLPDPPVIAAILALALLCTGLGYIIYFSLIAEAGATRASLITYVNPAVAVLLGVLILSEPLTVGTLLGFALIVFGCALATGVVRVPGRSPGPHRIAGSSAELAEGRSS
jgi:drug/metabolite transporter (DMT)-like permease